MNVVVDWPQTIDEPGHTFQSFPATRAPEIGFRNQCVDWWRKQFRMSVSRPEIPRDFMAHAEFLPLC